MKVAIFTDHDFAKVNGLSATLRAVLDHAPADVKARIYTCEPQRVARVDYVAMKGVGFSIPSTAPYFELYDDIYSRSAATSPVTEPRAARFRRRLRPASR
jgi:hypothetical protein